MPRRIIPVSSGKGGVGKTTFAVNFALTLARHASVILVDLDTGTSSVRTCFPVEPTRDLYHYRRQGLPLRDCITTLDATFDPDGLYNNFGFIASPRNFIHEIANPDEAFRRQMIHDINRLPADYVVVDLRAGMDENVIDFLPYANSGVLLFTPHHPAATVAASEIVKAILFRSLRIVFGKGSAFYSLPRMEPFHGFINDLLDQVEDVYDPSISNLDDFLRQLAEALGDHPILHAIEDTLEAFRVYYVLNMFNGVEDGYEGAVVPFVENLTRNVSSRLHITQLGWIVEDPRIPESHRTSFPVVLDRRAPPGRIKARELIDPIMAELEKLESAALGLKPKERRRTDRVLAPPSSKEPAADLLEGQLQTLKAMYTDRGHDRVKENFSYITYRALNLMSASYGVNELGAPQLASPERLLDWYMSRQLV